MLVGRLLGCGTLARRRLLRYRGPVSIPLAIAKRATTNARLNQTMKNYFLRWKLGCWVLVRYLFFSLLLSVSLSLLQVFADAVWPPVKRVIPKYGFEIGSTIGLLGFILFLPLLAYKAAQWTGLLQGGDEEKFKSLRKVQPWP
jgi:hypothetical protein